MVNAFTFDDGTPHSFTTRKAMYEYMIANGHVIMEGTDCPIFDAVLKNSTKENAKELEQRLALARGY